MAAAQQRRREEERRARGISGAALAAAAAPPPRRLNEGLAREKAVIEMTRLRRVVFGWMDEFERGEQFLCCGFCAVLCCDVLTKLLWAAHETTRPEILVSPSPPSSRQHQFLAAEHGRKPSLAETAEGDPEIYKAFVRFVGLREMLRGST